ncbi:hypothetical protein [Methanonatronarchaeum thermophilum]|uniref:hypothetical protein n=1 Tax=Methanonatronarchaeum thermophilum TaxID=1927129 RepID=UPI00117A7F03|nr:hypothetical protein [Methanonatronarchaeum thermophilum]
MDVKGNFALNIGGEKTATLHIQEKQITINIKKITKITKILKKIYQQTKQQKPKTKNQETTELPIKLITHLNQKGYKIKIKIKGLTIIRDLNPENLKIINKFI